MKLFKYIFLLSVFVATARNASTEIFDPHFKSLQVIDPTNLLGQPIIKPNNAASAIKISFDELADDSRFLRYRLIHCDSNWKPSQSITELDYIDGFNEAQVVDYALSDKSLTHYVHYNITIPNEDMRPLLSGNYLVEVFDEENPDETLLQARFMVDESLVGISMTASSRTDVDYNSKHQQLSVKANLENAHIDNAYNDLKLVIIPNGRVADSRTLLHPLQVTQNIATYKHQKELIFPAGNEYRRFDLANLRYPGMGVYAIDYVEPFYNAMLKTDTPRVNSGYTYDQTQAGRYFPAEIYSTEPEIDADYVLTFFTLQMPKLNEDVYLDGDFVLRKRNSDSRMIYDESNGAYIKTLLLKQGMYNYQYVTGSGLNPIEGDNYETGNEYVALLYYCPPGARYDRLIGSAIIRQ
ncbi:MAG: DUF5103 domain-containing protein [Bacteroides sp.]|nr:DUF5103 domain-containing protein [Bacteroides sp.]MCM1378696.1 DUF5103 domain-containing protein [Bacteroides sp.]MCM1444969.1 DUF5103 domain-containing protein [Prevotella sp.]